jgi:N-acetylneuraminate lyase
MDNSFLQGLIAAPFTPMDSRGDINLKPIEKYADHLVDSGVAGAFVCGTTGEGPSLTTEERKAVLEEWVKCSRGRLKIICHVGGNCLKESIELALHANETGAQALGAFPPFFFKPKTEQEILAFLAPVAASAPTLPFYYYHIPSLTGVNNAMIDLLSDAKKEIPNFAGIKYSHFDMFDMQQCIAFNDGQFEILHGYDEVLLAGLSLGVKAAVGSTYNYLASVYLKLWDAFKTSDIEKARNLQLFSVNIVHILNKYGGGVRAGKAIMELLGIDCGHCRLPLTKMMATEKDEFLGELERAGLFSVIKLKQ